MIDQKKCYLFGRNPQMCDFAIDHASCSRVHSALVWHKHLNRAFLVDLGSCKYREILSCCNPESIFQSLPNSTRNFYWNNAA